MVTKRRRRVNRDGLTKRQVVERAKAIETEKQPRPVMTAMDRRNWMRRRAGWPALKEKEQ